MLYPVAEHGFLIPKLLSLQPKLLVSCAESFQPVCAAQTLGEDVEPKRIIKWRQGDNLAFGKCMQHAMLWTFMRTVVCGTAH